MTKSQELTPESFINCKPYMDFLNSCKVKIYEKYTRKQRHHIIPRYAGGSNDKNNLITLSLEDHHRAHEILFEEFGRYEDVSAMRLIISNLKLTPEEYEARNDRLRNSAYRCRTYQFTKEQLEQELVEAKYNVNTVAKKLGCPDNLLRYYYQTFGIKTLTQKERYESQEFKDHLKKMREEHRPERIHCFTKEQLEQAIKNHNNVILHAAKSLGISDKLFRNRCKEVGVICKDLIPRKKLNRITLNKEDLENLFLQNNKNQRAVAKILDVDPSSLNYHLKKHSII